MRELVSVGKLDKPRNTISKGRNLLTSSRRKMIRREMIRRTVRIRNKRNLTKIRNKTTGNSQSSPRNQH